MDYKCRKNRLSLTNNCHLWLHGKQINMGVDGSYVSEPYNVHQLDFLLHKVEDGYRTFNRPLLHPAAANGQGRSKST